MYVVSYYKKEVLSSAVKPKEFNMSLPNLKACFLLNSIDINVFNYYTHHSYCRFLSSLLLAQ